MNASSCVRYYSKLSECNKCEVICPTDAIVAKEGGVAITQEKCIDCGGCVGVCPTEALSLSEFDVTNFFFEFVKSDEKIISCKSNFVCLAGLGVEYLIGLGVVKEVVLNIGHCKECNLRTSCFEQIESNVNEANYVLEAIGAHFIEAKDICVEEPKEANRREFFNLFTLKGALKAKQNFEEELSALEGSDIVLSDEEAKKIKEKSIPNKRKLLYTLLKKANRPQEYKLLENEYLSFTSDKEIDESCDNCSICYRICPTAALSTDKRASKILFDPFLCVRCHLCHDVCDKESIKLASFFDTKEFFEPSAKVLRAFRIERCEDCGMNFTYLGGERLCPRCKIEEEEAKSLWGIK